MRGDCTREYVVKSCRNVFLLHENYEKEKCFNLRNIVLHNNTFGNIFTFHPNSELENFSQKIDTALKK